MSFLAPWFIAGAFAVALPIAFHLWRRSPSGRQVFSTLMFLQPSPPVTTRRSHVDQWPLLILRGLILILLALAFGRPFLKREEATAEVSELHRRVVVLVDTSASMQRDDLWKQATAIAVESLDDDNELAVIAFDREASQVLRFDEWASLPAGGRRKVAAERIHKLKPGWHRTDLGLALQAAIDALESRANTTDIQARSEIFLVSDLQSGSRLQLLQQQHWPEYIELSVRRVAPEQPTNAGVQLVHRTEDDKTAADTIPIRVSNAKDSRKSLFELQWKGGEGETVAVSVAPGKSRVVNLTRPAGVSQLVLSGDDHEFDNTVHLATAQARTSRISCIGGGSPQDDSSPRFFLDSAFPQSSAREVKLTSHKPDEPLLLPPDTRLVIVMEAPGADTITALREFVQQGGTVFMSAGDDAACDAFANLTTTPVRRDLKSAEGNAQRGGERFQLLSHIDYEHPLMQPFSEVAYADFSKIHIWRHRRVPESLQEETHVVASLDDGAPALLEKRLGTGRAILCTFSWHPDDSQLARSSKFPALMNGLLDLAEGSRDFPQQFHVGADIRLASASSDEGIQVRHADGDIIQLAAAETKFDRTELPGQYTIERPNGTRQFAVNLPPEESRTSPLNDEVLEKLGVKLKREADSDVAALREAQARQLKNRELEDRQRGWRWCLLGVLVLVVVETWQAGRRPTHTEGQEAA